MSLTLKWSSKPQYHAGTCHRPGTLFYITWHDDLSTRHYTIHTPTGKRIKVVAAEQLRSARVENWKNP